MAQGQLVGAEEAYGRIQLPAEPEGSYRMEMEFTRLGGDAVAVMFPVGETSGLLVLGGWGGKVSGLAFVDGNDADRNATTRDGKFSNGEKHTLTLEVRILEKGRVGVSVKLDGEDYLAWEGERASLKPDRQWGLRSARAIGIGGYEAVVGISPV